MKRLLFSIALAALVSPAVSGPAKSVKQPTVTQQFDPVKSFQQLVAAASATKTWSRSFQLPTTQKWVRQNAVAGDVRYDVKKTDSLVNPLIGIVSFPVVISVSPVADTEQEALESTAPPQRNSTYDVDITYQIVSDRWVMHEIKYKGTDRENPLRGTVFTMDAEKFAKDKNSTLALALKPWVADL
ncbi:hypothetical protein QPK31_02805 [Massilia sp. YIM B02769]|uniref:hypothetical protein n=1 Tax=Massilia sp. YIM B02769 TaxID=3050129 RepID=UPI0025B65903|nr:hypothetical protein [Massilia sp. YIM B02769]MDN4057147.1 hypothetical protein [Massilia sp. YIM B02769]